MLTHQNQLSFFIKLAEVYAKSIQVFDRRLLGGLGFNEFIILFHIAHAPQQQIRRIDLAEKIGVTPSGITRMLLPMEKLGMVARKSDESDGRVSFVILAPGGKRLLEETILKAEELSEELLPDVSLAGKKNLLEIIEMFRV